MKIILVKKVSALGQVGDVKEVSDGYARNFLIPQGLARAATDAVIAQVAKAQVKKQQKQVNKIKDLEKVAKKLNNLKLVIQAKADEGNTLFGSINAQTIALELKKRGYDIDLKYIKLSDPIKKLGFYEIELEFAEETKAKIGLTISRED